MSQLLDRVERTLATVSRHSHERELNQCFGRNPDGTRCAGVGRPIRFGRRSWWWYRIAGVAMRGRDALRTVRGIA